MLINVPERDFRAFIFDCDGTLVDSMPLHHRAWQAAFEAHGATFEFTWELFMRRAGMGLAETVCELNGQFGLQLPVDAVVAQQRKAYDAELERVQTIQPVVKFASEHRGCPMSVASGGARSTVLRTLERAGIRQWFPHVVCRQDVPRGKPHPDSFLRCAELMGVRPSDCLVFEDAAAGIAAAKAAGMGWVAVDDSGRCGAP